MKKVNWKVYNEALGALQAQFTKWDAFGFSTVTLPSRAHRFGWVSSGPPSASRARRRLPSMQTGSSTLPWRQRTSCTTAMWWTTAEVISDAGIRTEMCVDSQLWHEDSLELNGSEIRWQAKVCEKHSEFGIDAAGS